MKTNKHFRTLVVALSILIFGLASCEKDSPETNNNSNLFVGKWKGKHAMQVELINVNVNVDITFNIDNTFSFIGVAVGPLGEIADTEKKGKGTYSYTETALTLTPDEPIDFISDSNEFAYKFSNGNSSLTIIGDNGTKITLDKQ